MKDAIDTIWKLFNDFMDNIVPSVIKTLLYSTFLMYIWNEVVTEVFHMQFLNFQQAIGLYVMCKLIQTTNNE